MKVRFLAILTVIAIISGMITIASAAVLPIWIDFTGSVSGRVPEGFDTWKSGGAMGKLPKIYAENGIFMKDLEDTSVKIESGSGVGISYKPYIQKELSEIINQDEAFSFGIRMAADDANSSKYAALGITNQDDDELELQLIRFESDGNIYILDEIIIDGYMEQTWYYFDLEFHNNVVGIYCNGQFIKEISSEILIQQILYLKCGMTGKIDSEMSAAVYFDDISIDKGTVPDERKIAVSADGVSIDNENLRISDIPQDASVSQVLEMIYGQYGEIIDIRTEDGELYVGEEFKSNLYIYVTSADGVNQIRYYLDLLNFDITISPEEDPIRQENILLGLSGRFLDDVSKVEYFIDDVSIGIADELPFSIEYSFTEPGGHLIYAVMDIGGSTEKTAPKRVTFSPNKPPTAEFLNLKDGDEVQYQEDFVVSVNASDEDGTIKLVCIFMDGTEYITNSTNSPYEFHLKNLSPGAHSVFAKVIDNEGAVTTTAVHTFTVKRTNIKIINEEDFSSTTEWQMFGANCYASAVKVRQDFGLSQMINIEKATETGETAGYTWYSSTNSLLSTQTVTMELDYMMEDTENVRVAMFTLRSLSGQFYGIGDISNGKIANKTLEENQWYHFKYVFNLQKKTAELYIDGEKIITSNTVNTNGTFDNVRFTIYNANIDKSIRVYLDNIKIYCEIDNPYITEIDFYSASGENVKQEDGSAGCDVKQIMLKFNTKINPVFSDKTYWEMQINNKKTTAFDVEIEQDNDASIIWLNLRSTAKSNAVYKITADGRIADETGATIGAEQQLSFRVNTNLFDVSEWKVYIGNKEIESLENIKKGDEIRIIADFVNQDTVSHDAVLIIAVYDGDQMIDYKSMSVNSADEETQFPKEAVFSIGEITQDIVVRGFLWNTMGTRAETAYFQMG